MKQSSVINASPLCNPDRAKIFVNVEEKTVAVHLECEKELMLAQIMGTSSEDLMSVIVNKLGESCIGQAKRCIQAMLKFGHYSQIIRDEYSETESMRELFQAKILNFEFQPDKDSLPVAVATFRIRGSLLTKLSQIARGSNDPQYREALLSFSNLDENSSSENFFQKHSGFQIGNGEESEKEESDFDDDDEDKKDNKPWSLGDHGDVTLRTDGSRLVYVTVKYNGKSENPQNKTYHGFNDAVIKRAVETIAGHFLNHWNGQLGDDGYTKVNMATIHKVNSRFIDETTVLSSSNDLVQNVVTVKCALDVKLYSLCLRAEKALNGGYSAESNTTRRSGLVKLEPTSTGTSPGIKGSTYNSNPNPSTITTTDSSSSVTSWSVNTSYALWSPDASDKLNNLVRGSSCEAKLMMPLYAEAFEKWMKMYYGLKQGQVIQRFEKDPHNIKFKYNVRKLFAAQNSVQCAVNGLEKCWKDLRYTLFVAVDEETPNFQPIAIQLTQMCTTISDQLNNWKNYFKTGEFMDFNRKLLASDHLKPENWPTSHGALSCSLCSDPAELRCSRCKSVTYCCSNHQKNDWKRHKQLCCSIPEVEYGHDFEVADEALLGLLTDHYASNRTTSPTSPTSPNSKGKKKKKSGAARRAAKNAATITSTNT